MADCCDLCTMCCCWCESYIVIFHEGSSHNPIALRYLYVSFTSFSRDDCLILVIVRKRNKSCDFEDHDIHEQFESQYDPHHNSIYNVDRDIEPPTVTGHGRVLSQPMGHGEMIPSQRAHGGEAPFSPRPLPDQLPAYSSQPVAPQVLYPPATLQPGRRAERQSVQPSGGGMGLDVRSSHRIEASHSEPGS